MIWAWLTLLGFVFAMLALDPGVFNRKSHVAGFKESPGWSAVWITLGLSFPILVYFACEFHWFDLGRSMDAVDRAMSTGKLAATEYLEKSLSVDNIIVIAVVFGSLAVPARHQHGVLVAGILGGLMSGQGSLLVRNFPAILYVFGAFLIFTGIKMLVMEKREEHQGNNPAVRWIRRILPITRDFHGQHFMARAGSRWSREAAEPGEETKHGPVVESAPADKWPLTALAFALILAAVTDLIFAVDSIPAVFATTADPFLVFTSSVFAILGLVGLKMPAAGWLKVWLGDSFSLAVLAVIPAILATGILTSMPPPARRIRRGHRPPESRQPFDPRFSPIHTT